MAYIAVENPEAAQRLNNRVLAAVEHAAEMPFAGRIVPELNQSDARERIVRPYRVVYRVAETHIIVWAVHHSHRPMSSDVIADEPVWFGV